MKSDNFLRGDYHLTTAEILYYMPDHPSLIQSFIWQQYDLAPHYPALRKFLDYWTAHIDAKLHSVCVGSREVFAPPEITYAATSLTIH